MSMATLPSASVSLPSTTAASNTSYALAAPRSGHDAPASVPYISEHPTGMDAAVDDDTTMRVAPVSAIAGWNCRLKLQHPWKSTCEDLHSVLVSWWKLMYHWS